MGEDLKPMNLYFKDPTTDEYKPLVGVESVDTLEAETQGTDDITASYLHSILRVWDAEISSLEFKTYELSEYDLMKAMWGLNYNDLNGRWTISGYRRKKRKAAKRRGRWVEHKLHFAKNGRDNLYYEWRA